jgi:histone H3/H4
MVYFQLRKIGEKYISSVIRYAIIYAEYAKRMTISEDDVLNALEKTGFVSLYPTTGKIKQCKISNRKNVLSKIREYQQQHDCFTLAKAPIEALIKKECDDLQKGFKWSFDAIKTLHLALEYMLYKLCFSANKIAIHSNRRTIQHKDISLAIELINDNCQFEALQDFKFRV